MPVSSNTDCLIVSLSGGLGNQLFQWATGFSLARTNNLNLVLSDLEIGERSFQLQSFGIAPPRENLDYLSRIAILRRKNQENHLQKIAWLVKYPFLSNRIILEKDFAFDPKISRKAKAGTILKGTFQSERYFSKFFRDIKNTLLNGFSASDLTQETVQKYSSDRWVGVHVRRGDYLKFRDVFGPLGPDYFRRARDRLVDLFGSDLRFILFSDDNAEAEKVCDWADEIAPENNEPPAQALWLLSRANAIIGSNSTFSWWASFLSSAGTPSVFPKPWFPGELSLSSDVTPSWADTIERGEGWRI